MNQSQDSQNLSSLWHTSCAAANINALPVEILAHVFAFCTDQPNKSFPLHQSPAWLPITHVCRHWRIVALSHPPLWTSITPELSLRWVKIFMERSRTMLMDFDICISLYRETDYFKDIILLLSDFTRIRSLRFTGTHRTVCPIIDSLCTSLPVQSLSLFLDEYGEKFEHVFSDNLFGGMAPIRRLHFVVNGRVVVPHWLLRGLTHFTSTESISPTELLNILPQMPALTYLELHPLSYLWSEYKPQPSPIQIPQLKNLISHATHDPETFVLLNRLLLLNDGAKRRLELHLSEFCGWFPFEGLLPVIEAAGGFQHVHFSGDLKKGWFRIWTGCAATAWEDAAFCLFAEWKTRVGSYPERSKLRSHFYGLGMAQARRLVIDFPHVDVWKFKLKDLSMSYWWGLLKMLPGIEELELYLTGAGVPGDVWKVSKAPAVLPALRRVRIVADGTYASPRYYAIVGDLPTREIVQVPNITEVDTTSVSELSAENELENMSGGLLRFLQGLAGTHLFDDSS
ncbi:hypothetical protein V8E53_001757 [Lactarius tabidus]